jgi:hypothetical protein
VLALDQDQEPQQSGNEARRRDRMAMTDRPQKITFGEMRAWSIALITNAAKWLNEVWLSDIEEQFTWTRCGKRGADVRPDFNSARRPLAGREQCIIAAAYYRG